MTLLLQAVGAGALLLLAYAAAQALLLVLRCYRARALYESSSIPGPPLSKHVLGHAPETFLHPKGPWQLAQWVATYGPLYKLHFLDQFGVVLTDPDAIASITRRTGPGPYLHKPYSLYHTFEMLVQPQRPNILTSLDTPYWKAVRHAAAPCFSMSNMKQVVPLVLVLTQRAAERMAQHDSFDVSDAAKRITSDVMGQLLLGQDLRGTHWEASDYFEAFNGSIAAMSCVPSNPFHLWQLWDPRVRYQRRCLQRHTTLVGGFVRQLREEPPAPHTIAAHLLSAVDPATGKPLDDNQIKAEIAIFMGAGFETTSHAITWSLAMLAAHPEVQDQVLAELQEAGLATKASGVPGRPFAAGDLGRLPLLSAVIKEVLRLCPPAPFGGTRHVVTKEGVELCGHNLPQGTMVMICPLPFGLAQHNFGPDAGEFRPQRWTADAASAGPGDASTFGTTTAAAGLPDPLTFLVGPRDCIGQNLAKLELQVVLATLLSRFRFSPGPELEAELKLAAATGQPAVAAVHALAGTVGTLQPLSGRLMLGVGARV